VTSGQGPEYKKFIKNVLFVRSTQMLLVNHGLVATLSGKTHRNLAICLWMTN